jgi:hypothetical protein
MIELEYQDAIGGGASFIIEFPWSLALKLIDGEAS